MEYKLNSYNKQIKEEINKILDEEIKTHKKRNKKDLPEVDLVKDLMRKMEDAIRTQNKEVEKAIIKRNQEVEIVINNILKDKIIFQLDKLKFSINQINDSKNILSNNRQKCQNMIVTLNQRENEIENKFYFLSNEIKKKIQILNLIKKNRDDLFKKINLFESKINSLQKIINDFNRLEKNIPCDDLVNNFDNEIQKISNLKVIIEKELIDIKTFDNRDNYINFQIYSDILNIGDDDFIIQDNFYKEKDSSDPIYNRLLKNEKQKLINIFNDKRKSIENKIIGNKLFNIQYIISNIINQIIINEQSKNFFKNKIIKKISSIAKDDNKYKINHLTILIVGRKGIGKKTLIKYILDSNKIKIKKVNSDFVEFTSDKIQYFKLIEVKGIGHDDDTIPEMIKEKIKNYVDNLINNNNQNYNDIVHCIWYCISDNKFQKTEKLLFNSLKKIYKDNIMPIIFVYTKTVDFNLASSMEKYLRGEDIDNSFVTVMAQDMPLVNEKIQEAFGREELIKTTLTKCTEALGGNMLKIMIHLISNNIKQNIIEENNNIMNQIVSKTRDNFIEKYNEYLGDGAFINHIINIFFNYLNEFMIRNRL